MNINISESELDVILTELNFSPEGIKSIKKDFQEILMNRATTTVLNSLSHEEKSLFQEYLKNEILKRGDNMTYEQITEIIKKWFSENMNPNDAKIIEDIENIIKSTVHEFLETLMLGVDEKVKENIKVKLQKLT